MYPRENTEINKVVVCLLLLLLFFSTCDKPPRHPLPSSPRPGSRPPRVERSYVTLFAIFSGADTRFFLRGVHSSLALLQHQ